VTSPTRTYVAMCNATNFDNFYFRVFMLPEEYDNNADRAAWYFLNRINFVACLSACFPFENLELSFPVLSNIRPIQEDVS
jgi:hypothetical protein